MLVEAFQHIFSLPENERPDVINMSLSYPNFTYPVYDVIEQAVNDYGIIVVAATGNSSNLWDKSHDLDYFPTDPGEKDLSVIKFPAAHTEVIAVGSVSKQSDGGVGISDFSNAGGSYSGSYDILNDDPDLGSIDYSFNAAVDVVAPGEGIYSWYYSGQNIVSLSGTSMATPHVSAFAALLKDKFPNLTVSEIRTLIQKTASAEDILIPDGMDKTTLVGYGLIDIRAAYDFNFLKTLELTDVDFTYDKYTDGATVTVPYSTDYIGYTFTADDFGTLVLEDGVITNESFSIDSDVNTFVFKSTFGGYDETYTLVIEREAPTLSSVEFVKDFDLGEVTIIPNEVDLEVLTHDISFSVSDIKMKLQSEGIVKIQVDDQPVVTDVEHTLSLSSIVTNVIVTVESADDSSKKTTYNFNLSYDDSIFLSDIIVNGSSISTFDTDKNEYNESKLYYDEELTIVGTTQNPDSTVSYSLNDGDFKSSFNMNEDIPIPGQINNIRLKVTNDNSNENIYTVFFERDNGVDLINLDLYKNDDINQKISKGTFESNIDIVVTNDVESIRLSPTIEDDSRNGGSSASFSYKLDDAPYGSVNTFDLNVGMNTILIKVYQGESGTDNYIEKVYTVHVNRTGNADFSNIDLTPRKDEVEKADLLYTSYSFNSATKEVSLDLSNKVSDVVFNVTKEDDSATLFVESGDLTINSNTLTTGNLSNGLNTFVFGLEYGTEGDPGYLKQTYTYHLNVIDVTELSDIYIKVSDENKLTLDKDNQPQSVQVPYGTSSIKFKAVKASEYASMILVYDDQSFNPYDGSEKIIDFTDAKTITLEVTSPIADESITYTFNVSESALDNDSTLSSLSVSDYGISPSFTSGIMSYSLNVPNSVSAVTINATRASLKATMTINEDVIDSQSNSKNISLSVGSNIANVLVTAEDGTTTNYKITITRGETPVTDPVDSGSSGGSSGGSPGVPPAISAPIPEPEDKISVIKSDDGTEKTVVEVSDERISNLVEDEDQTTILITVEEGDQAEIALTSDALEEITESGKPLEVSFKEVSFELDTNVLKGLSVNDNLKIVVGRGDSKLKDLKVISEVFELDLIDGDKKMKFDVPVPIVFSYDASKVKSTENLAIYYLDEITSEWVYVGCKLLDGNRISFEAKHFSMYAIRENNKTFDDIQTHWAKGAIETLASREITSGVSLLEFAPDKTLTNAEFVVLLVKVLGLPEYEGSLNYSNIETGDWFEPYFRKAQGVDLLHGTYSVMMDPNEPIKREEMVSLLTDAYFYYTKKDKGQQLISAVKFANDE